MHGPKAMLGGCRLSLPPSPFRSRLVRSWTHLERQRGGGGFLGGPGERQLELDKRMLTNQIRQIKGELAEVRRTRTLQRVRRQKSHTPSVALVGYTNAGKSTLFNRLTGADVLSKDMLFATLDPTIRGCKLPSGRTIMISDTVGFISALPTELVEAFKSTLEEVIEADLILHVHDLSAHNFEQEAEDVTRILTEIGLDSLDREDRLIHVFNKCDNLHDEEQQLLAESIRAGVAEPFGHSIVCSAITDEGLDDLFSAMDQFFNRDEKLLCLQLKPEEASAGAWLHQNGQVHISEYDNKGMHLIKVSLSQANLARFMKSWPAIQIVQQEYPK